MFVRSHEASPQHSTYLRKARRKLWDGLTITLAIAVVLLGLAILIHPKRTPESEVTPTKTVSPLMASVAAPLATRG
jgi:hypothetical protein